MTGSATFKNHDHPGDNVHRQRDDLSDRDRKLNSALSLRSTFYNQYPVPERHDSVRLTESEPDERTRDRQYIDL